LQKIDCDCQVIKLIKTTNSLASGTSLAYLSNVLNNYPIVV